MRHTVLFRLLLLLVFSLLPLANASAEFKLRHRGSSGHLVVFVHGLWGDPLQSFSAGAGQPSWLDLMKGDNERFLGAPALSTYSTATLGYPAAGSFSPNHIVGKLAADLLAEEEIGKHSAIYFVGHSFGGLVVEQLLVDARIAGLPLSDRTRGVFLIATPSQGAPLASVAELLPGDVRGQLVMNLKTGDANNFLDGLRRQWQAVLKSRGNSLVFECAYETEPTIGRHVVVPAGSIDASCFGSAYPVKANHIRIVKPTSRTDEIYRWLLRMLARINGPGLLSANRPPADVVEKKPSTTTPTLVSPPQPVVPSDRFVEARQAFQDAKGSEQRLEAVAKKYEGTIYAEYAAQELRRMRQERAVAEKPPAATPYPVVIPPPPVVQPPASNRERLALADDPKPHARTDPNRLLGNWTCQSVGRIESGRTRNQMNCDWLMTIERYDGKYYWEQSSRTCDGGATMQTKSKFWSEDNQLFRSAYWTSDVSARPLLNRQVPVRQAGDKLTWSYSAETREYRGWQRTTCSRGVHVREPRAPAPGTGGPWGQWNKKKDCGTICLFGNCPSC